MKNAKWWLPILLMVLITPFTADWDLALSRYFYNQAENPFASNKIYEFLYHYGILPADLITAFGVVAFVLSFFIVAWKKWRYIALMLAATMLVGGWIIVHEILKDHWGRPRPRQVTEFGGSQIFRSYYQPNLDPKREPSKSFACGHASMGFYFFAIAMLGTIYQSRLLYWLGWGSAFGLGSLLSIARIAQGGHFLSDTIASALIMWLTAWILAYFLFVFPKQCDLRRIEG